MDYVVWSRREGQSTASYSNLFKSDGSNFQVQMSNLCDLLKSGDIKVDRIEEVADNKTKIQEMILMPPDMVGRNFHFRVGAHGGFEPVWEIPTEKADREGYMLPVRPGEVQTQRSSIALGDRGIEVTVIASGEMETRDNKRCPVWTIQSTKFVSLKESKPEQKDETELDASHRERDRLADLAENPRFEQERFIGD